MKNLLISIFLVVPVLLFSQDKGTDKASGSQLDLKKEPVLTVLTDLFKLKNLSFSKSEKEDKGEILGTVFQLENLSNVSLDLYIFVIATYEKEYVTKSSFESPDLDDPVLIKNIQVFPGELSNFQYTVKDKKGVEKTVYQKYPKNIKEGIDPKTGKPYHLEDVLTFGTEHFSKYIRKYYYFNTVTILIFDSEEQLLYRRNFSLNPVRR